MVGVLLGFFPSAPFKFAGFIRAKIKKNVEATSSVLDPKHPYREAAIVESYEEAAKAILPRSKFWEAISDKPKKKREPIVLPKSIVVFMLLVPAMLTDIGLGFAYDSPSIGTGTKWGMFAAGVLTNIFFIVCAIARSEKKE